MRTKLIGAMVVVAALSAGTARADWVVDGNIAAYVVGSYPAVGVIKEAGECVVAAGNSGRTQVTISFPSGYTVRDGWGHRGGSPISFLRGAKAMRVIRHLKADSYVSVNGGPVSLAGSSRAIRRIGC